MKIDDGVYAKEKKPGWPARRGVAWYQTVHTISYELLWNGAGYSDSCSFMLVYFVFVSALLPSLFPTHSPLFTTSCIYNPVSFTRCGPMTRAYYRPCHTILLVAYEYPHALWAEQID